jgi:hypothetical protein
MHYISDFHYTKKLLLLIKKEFGSKIPTLKAILTLGVKLVQISIKREKRGCNQILEIKKLLK